MLAGKRLVVVTLVVRGIDGVPVSAATSQRVPCGSADTGGIIMLAATLPMSFVPPLGGRIVTALGWRWHFALAFAIMTIGSAGFVVVLTANGTPYQWPVILAMIVVGLGAALAHPQLSGAVVALVPSEQAGMASAVTIVTRQAGFAVGIAAFGALPSSSDRAVAFFSPS